MISDKLSPIHISILYFRLHVASSKLRSAADKLAVYCAWLAWAKRVRPGEWQYGAGAVTRPGTTVEDD